ncbi:phage tail spike protein [Intestinibacter sp.]|uniref:phage tail spike protein n=1 Tax=Intestinibacter sp. TaxID=1965304 RepID=UPI00307DF00A
MTDITLFILDKNKRIIDVVSNAGTEENAFWDDTFTQEINVASIFEFSLELNQRTKESIKTGNYILFRYRSKNFLFTIVTVETDDSNGYAEAQVYCESISLILYNSVIQKNTLNNCNATTFLTTILQDTDFLAGYIDVAVNRNAALIEIDKATSVYELLTSKLETYKAEMDIRIEVEGNKVTDMYIDLYSKLGSDNGARFDYNTNLESVNRKEDISVLCTAIIGIGKDDLDFREAEWNIEAGKPADKPRGANFIADDIANAMFGFPGKYIYGIYEDDSCEDAYTLLEKSYEALQERKQPKVDYECKVAYLDGDINLGDAITIVDRTYPEPLQLTARVNKLEISFSDESKNTCSFANYNKAYSNMITKNDTFEQLKNYILGLNIGKLTLAEIEIIKQYMRQLGIDKETIDKLFSDILNNPDTKPGTGGNKDTLVKTIEGGLWLGDSRMVAMKKYNLFKLADSDTSTEPGTITTDDYKKALELYQSIGTGSQTGTSAYEKLVSSSNQYKISTIVKYWAPKFGLDPNLVFAMIMAESSGIPTAHGSSSGSGYGLMGCERSVFFNQTQTIKFIDGTKQSFTPSYSTMQPGSSGNTVINGITVDKNISNQVMLGCNEIKTAMEYAHNNIFAGLISYNMGVGAMYWIVSRYVCDTYGYTFVNRNSIKAQTPEAQKKIYEVLENGGFEFADWRQIYKNNGGGGTVKNVEGYLKWYKIENGQLPYVLDSAGNKLGYGVSGKITTTYSATNNNVVTYVTNTSLTQTRTKIVDKAKEIVKLHQDGLASYSQYPRTIDDTKRKYIAKGTYVKMGSNSWGYAGSTYFGISTSVNDGKGVIGYDCSSFASCCYMNAGLKSMYNGNCSGGTIMSEIVNNGGMMWLANAEGRKKAKPGDCIMFCTNHIPTQADMDNRKLLATHHIGVYIGDDQMAHASQWAQVPNAIKISNVSSYGTLKYAFFIRPKDLQETDNNESIVEDTTTDEGNNIISKCVIGASAYHFYSGNQLKKIVQVGSYSDTTEYPSDVPYVFVHLGVNDPYQSGYSALKNLLSLLRAKYPKRPIFVAKEIHVGSKVSNYVDYNKAIDTFNTQILDYCNNHENVYQIDISESLEENGLLKSDITADGIHLKTKDNYKVLFNNIKNKIKTITGNTGNTESDIVDSDSEDTGDDDDNVKQKVNETLQSMENYYYDILDSLIFELPSNVIDSFYCRLKFTASTDFNYIQSDNCYLEGTDCINGQLVPKPNNTYKIIIMKNTIDTINSSYYGLVTVLQAKEYEDFTDFIGGQKVVELGKTYLSHTDLEYAGQYSTTAIVTPANFTNPKANLSKWYDSTRNKNQIDGSTLVQFVYMGLAYKNTPYNNHDMTSINKNSLFSWAFKLPRLAANQAKYCVSNGWALYGADLTNFSNLEAGDLIFSKDNDTDNNRYMNVSHVSIFIGEEDGVLSVLESTKCENGVKITPIADMAETILFIARVKKK